MSRGPWLTAAFKAQMWRRWQAGETCSEIIAFRARHFDYAVNYIEKKVDNPIATGALFTSRGCGN